MGGKNTFSNLAENFLSSKGQDLFRTQPIQSSRLIYSAIVRSVDDQAFQNRIQAEIVGIDVNGQVIPGKDRDIPLEKLPICLPFGSEFLHVRPKVGEMVWVISENPTDITSPRFWFGPVITNQIKLPFQAYEESVNIYNNSSFQKKEIHDGATLQNQLKQRVVLASQNEIALQGRDDSDIVLRPREVELRAGRFKNNSVVEINTDNPCRIQLKQFDTNPNQTGIKSIDINLANKFIPFSQININATNINLISNEGKFKKIGEKNQENNNQRLKDFGEVALKLHPVAFADELIVLLKLMLQYMFTHIHTPQNPALPNNISAQLEHYLNSGKLNDIASDNIRVN
jgi:hypothetical protein